ILGEVVRYVPAHPSLYDPEIMATEHLGDIFKGVIRESIFENVSDEIPFEADVIVNKVEEKPSVDVIKATIIVQKDTQKGMSIGKG
ncbi:GTPase Era, partial [Aliarcobacter butzleri]